MDELSSNRLRPGTCVVFDTSSARSLGRLSGREWQTLHKAFKKSGLLSAWIPRVFGAELLGSNLLRHSLTVEGLREMQRAVARTNKLARGLFLPDDRELSARSIFQLAGRLYPTEAYWTNTRDWRSHARMFCEIRSPDQVTATAADGVLTVTLTPNDGSSPVDVRAPRDDKFVEHATRVTEEMRGRIQDDPGLTVADMIVQDLPERIVSDCREFGVSLEVARAAIESLEPRPGEGRDAYLSRIKAAHEVPLVYRMSCEYAFYAHRARVRGQPKAVERNDYVDLSLTGYLVEATLVIEERKMRRNVLGRVVRPSAFATLNEFRRRLGLPI